MKVATIATLICLLVSSSMVSAQQRPTPQNHEKLKGAMGWMIGTWEGQTSAGSRNVFDCKWVLDKQFMHATVAVGTPLQEFLHVIIGWNPVDKKFTAAGFSVVGGQSTGECVKALDNELHFAVKGVSPDGPASLTLVYSHPAEDAFVVEYRDWIVGGEKRDPFKVEFKLKTN